MKPFTPFAYVLRFLWDGIPLLLWATLAYFLYRRLTPILRTQYEITVPLSVGAVFLLMWLLRPIRKFLMMNAYYLMVRFGYGPVLELGLWKLLILADRYWSTELPLYEGTDLFHRAYSQRSAQMSQRINRILWRVEWLAEAYLAKSARAFLREVNAPILDEAHLAEL